MRKGGDNGAGFLSHYEVEESLEYIDHLAAT